MIVDEILQSDAADELSFDEVERLASTTPDSTRIHALGRRWLVEET